LGFPCDVLGFCLQVQNLLVGLWKQESFKDELFEMPVCGFFIFFVYWFFLGFLGWLMLQIVWLKVLYSICVVNLFLKKQLVF